MIEKLRLSTTPKTVIFILTSILVFCWILPAGIASPLPPASSRAPVPISHFPDRLHAVVWRNWGLVELDRVASVVGATPDQLIELAESMGLQSDTYVSPEMQKRSYITIIRRNWHLLPYDQLCALLGLSEEELSFILREDDFLYIKLGSLKPTCEPVLYAAPSDAARRRAGEIRQLVKRHFGDQAGAPSAPRFDFIEQFSTTPASTRNDPPANSSPTNVNPRFIYSYFALFGDPLGDPTLDPFPDGLLARLQDVGVNGVWLHTVLRQLAPGGSNFPEWGEGHERRLANLRRLVDRAKKYNIDIYLYMNEPRAMPDSFFKNRPEMAGVSRGGHTAVCTSDPRVRQWLSDSLAHIFGEVPGLGGIFCITASENLTNCASHGIQRRCPHCQQRSQEEIIAEVVAAMEAGVHRSAPDAKVIVWDWGWNGHGEATELITMLPQDVWLMSVSEWALPIKRGGVQAQVGEYSISAVGPGPRASLHWETAKQHGMRTVAKVQFNNSCELLSLPYLPVMNLIAEHCVGLAEANNDGLMLSWSFGGYPSCNLEIAQLFEEQPAITKDLALQTLAERHFGRDAAPHVRRAWTQFSEAFQEFPYHIRVLYWGPQHMGPANLLFESPTGYAATMTGLPYDDLDQWRGPYPPDVFVDQFEKVAAGWAEGLTELEAAQALVPDPLKDEAGADLRIAQAVHLHFASSANQARYLITRGKLREASDHADKSRLLGKLDSTLRDEIDFARRLYDLCAADSRIGYEASNQYFYVPQDLVEKVINCAYLRDRFAESGHP